MKHLSKILVLTVIGVLLTYGLLWYNNRKEDLLVSLPVLQPNEKEKVIVNPRTHSISIVTDKGIKNTYVGNRPVSIIEKKDGSIEVHARQWGTEFQPFIGLGYSDSLRPHLGVSVFYVKRLDLNLALAPTLTIKDLRLVGSISYNVYSNTSVFVGIDQHKEFHAGLFLRF